MGFSLMVRWLVRVVAFVAIACLPLQAACTIDLPQLTSAQIETHGDIACHESAPSTPNAPDPSHICCSGDHPSDALLSATVMSAPLILVKHLPIPIFEVSASMTSSADRFTSFSRPPGSLTLRI
jgi:hypothetical protein